MAPFRHPFGDELVNRNAEIRETYETRTMMAELLSAIERVRPAIGNMSLDDRRAWWIEAKPMVDEVLEKVANLTKRRAEMKEAGDAVLDDNDDLRNAVRGLRVSNAGLRDAEDILVSEFADDAKEAMQVIVDQLGYDGALACLMSQKADASPPVSPKKHDSRAFQQVVAVLRNNFGANDEETASINAVLKYLRSIGTQFGTMKLELDQAPSRQLSIASRESSILHVEVPGQQGERSTTASPDGDESEDDEETPPREFIEKEDSPEQVSDIALLRHTIRDNAAETRIIKLEGQLTDLQKTVLRHHVFGTQYPDSLIADVTTRLDTVNPPPRLDALPYLEMGRYPTLADAFPLRPYEPVCTNLERYVQAITLNIRDLWDATDKLRVEKELPWLNASITKIVRLSGDGLERTLPRLLNYVEHAAEIKPGHLGRPALFMTLGNMHRRSGRKLHIWTDVRDAVAQGQWGRFDQDWTLLDRISYAYFASAGLDSELRGDPASEQQTSINELIGMYRTVSPPTIFRVLESAISSGILASEPPNTTLFAVHKAPHVELMVMRTGEASSGIIDTEYVWLRRKSRVSFHSTGLAIHVDDSLKAFTQPSGLGSGSPWFEAVDKMARYLDKYYREEWEEALAIELEEVDPPIQTKTVEEGL